MKASLAPRPTVASGVNTPAAQTTLLVADGSCPKIRELLAEALVPVLWLGGDQDPLEVVTVALAERRQQGQPVQMLHWVSHGSPGVLQMGQRHVDTEALLANQAMLAIWNISKIAFWSCRYGANKAALSLWEELTGASAYAADSPLGLQDSGERFWQIRSSSGSNDLSFPVNERELSLWPYRLATVDSTQFNNGGAGLGAAYVRGDDPTDSGKVSDAAFDQIFASGIDLGGTNFSDVYINNNGTINFGGSTNSFTPTGLSAGVQGKASIALHWTDLDTRSASTTGGAGGGTNLVYYGNNGTDTVAYTWDDVGYFSNGTTAGITGQILLAKVNSADVDIKLIYEYSDVASFGAAYGSRGAAAGLNLGVFGDALWDNIDYVQIASSANPVSGTNGSTPGVFEFSVRSGALVGTGSGAAPVIVASQTLEQSSLTAATGYSLGSVQASDADDTVSKYRFNWSNGKRSLTSEDGYFTINASTGELTLAAAGETAYQALADGSALSSTVTVQVADGNNNGSAPVSVSVILNKAASAAPSATSAPASAPAPAPASAPVDNTPSDPAPAGTNIQPTDDDGDGLKEVVTASDGSTVDGNRDGIADADQTDVAGLRLINDGAVGSDYGAVQVSAGTQLSGVTLISPDAETGALTVTGRDGGTVLVELPLGISNGFAGAVAFDVNGLEIGGSTSTTINLPTGLDVDSANGAYMRFNYITNRFEEYVDAQGNPLYSFQDTNGDGILDAVVLQLVDGDPQWDGDGVANGAVVDPGFLGTGVRTFTGTKRDDTLIGNVLANELDGSSGRDWLDGGLGDDVLWGGKGKDYLHGGEGADFISGGKKWRDYIVYSAASDSTLNRSDTVKFHRNDRLDFRDFDGDSLTDGRQVLRYIGDAAFSGLAGELRSTREGLQADTTGDGAADFVVNFFRSTDFFSEKHLLL